MATPLPKLRSPGLDRAHVQQHPEIPYSIIGGMCWKEAQRLNNFSKPQSRAPQVITKEERSYLLETVILTLEILYKALQAQECHYASMLTVKQLFQEMNI